MRLYNFTYIETDSILTDDVICQEDLQNIIKSTDIISSARKKACLQLLNYREKNRQCRFNARKKIAQHVRFLRQRVRNNSKVRYDSELRNAISWMIDIQHIERQLLHDVLSKTHFSLTQALPMLISSNLDWDRLLSDMIIHELEDNHITGRIRITCNPSLELKSISQEENKNIYIIHDDKFPVNKLIIENKFIRITLDPLKQIDVLLDLFKLMYLNLIEKG